DSNTRPPCPCLHRARGGNAGQRPEQPGRGAGQHPGRPRVHSFARDPRRPRRNGPQAGGAGAEVRQAVQGGLRRDTRIDGSAQERTQADRIPARRAGREGIKSGGGRVTAGKQGAASVTPTTLPDGWSVEQFGNLVENYDSVRVPVRQGDRRPGSYPYYGASGIVDHVDGYLFHGEYLLIAEDGENLRTRQTPIAFLATGKFWVNNHAHIVRANSRASTRFLAYVLAHADVSGYLTGSTMPKLTQANMNRIPLAAPPVDEQRAIAGVLGALDGKIELNRRTNETLEAIARALFKSWFVDSANGLKTAKFSTIAMLSRGAINPSDSPQEIFEHYSIPAYDERRMPVAEFGTAIKSNKFVVPLDCVLLSKLNPRIPRVWMPDVARERRAVSSTEFLVLRPTHVSREYLYGLC